jgi:hypothetical protein
MINFSIRIREISAHSPRPNISIIFISQMKAEKYYKRTFITIILLTPPVEYGSTPFLLRSVLTTSSREYIEATCKTL